MEISGRTLRVLLVVFVVVLAGCSSAVPVTETEPGGNVGESTADAGTSSGGGVNGSLEVHYINVGQSLSVLVIGPTGETLLYDTGHYQDDGEHVLQYLRAHNITRIDHLVVSHNDADHIGGNAAIIEYFETEADGIGAVYDPGIAASTQTYSQYLDAIEAHGVTLYETREGDSIQFEGVDVGVFGPPEPYLESEARNENSIVLKLAFGETSVLLTGDAEDDQEAYLVSEYGERLNATVLKAGHHGSSSSTSPGLLDAVQPQIVVISSAYDSQYGHPTSEMLDRLSARGIPAYWTATHGDIVLASDGERVSVRTQAEAPTDPDQLREGNPVEPSMSGEVVERTVLNGRSLQTETTTTVATDGGTTTMSGAGGALAVREVHADAEGADGENLNDEYVVLENTGSSTLDLSGWTIADEAGHTYTVPEGTTLASGDTLTVHTGSGSDTASDLYWGSGSPIWNNGDDTVIVRNSQGDVILEYTYE
ncbi:lamin tail domain-containing protein [Halorubellus sp. PRR65]|uniref:lamin tail domain-containing protein n=1 Tax=Halorubellus sp. PRR65 TaxID=3098148 RepID=UPI002B25CC32|nr:lamin tail domain-containing protein [Halorubellus sp. PRR65]